jgi:uncharacterized protein YcfJ
MVRKAVAAAIVLTGTFASAAYADSRGYCEAYARDVAERRTNGGADVLVGTLGGALTGAFIGGLIDKGEGAGKGAIIGGVSGTVLGAGAASEKYKQTYERAYSRCMADYAVEAEDDDDDDDAPAAPVRRAKRKSVDRGDAWAANCAARYRSFDRKTGRYKSYSGKYKTCRL